jgi:hypothetical protein
MTIISRPNLPPNTLAELITYIKANGDKMTFGNAGLGAASQLCGLMFMDAIDKQILSVPYKGNGPVMNDLIAGQIDLTCDQTTNTTGPIAAKLVKSYAITTKTRLSSMPDLPTADEAGLKGFEAGAWHGSYAPTGTPDDIVQKLAKTLQESLRDPELIKRFNDINTDPVPQDQATPQALKKQLDSEVDRWAPIIKASGQQLREGIACQILIFALALIGERIEVDQDLIDMAWMAHHESAIREAVEKAGHQRAEVGLLDEVIGASESPIECHAGARRTPAKRGAERVEQQRLRIIEALT